MYVLKLPNQYAVFKISCFLTHPVSNPYAEAPRMVEINTLVLYSKPKSEVSILSLQLQSVLFSTSSQFWHSYHLNLKVHIIEDSIEFNAKFQHW